MRLLLIALRLWWLVRTTRILTDPYAPGEGRALLTDYPPLNNHIADGTLAFPVTAIGSTFRVSRTERYATVVAGGNNEANAGILATSYGLYGTTMQTLGILGQAVSYGMSTADNAAYALAHPGAPANNDAVGVAGIGVSQPGNRGGGAGMFAMGIRNDASGGCSAMEGTVRNGVATQGGIFTNGNSDVSGFVATIAGSANGGDAFVVHSADAGVTHWRVGYHTTSQGPTEQSILIDDSATYVLRDRGSHQFGVDLASGTYSAAGVRLNKSDALAAINNAGTANVKLIGKENAATDRVSIAGGVLLVDPASAHHKIVQAALPTVAVGAGAGTGGTATVAAGSSDMEGRVDVVAGTAPTASATIFTVTFHTAFDVIPLSVVVCGCALANLSLAQQPQAFEGANATTQWVLTAGTPALVAGSTYRFGYRVLAG